MRYLVALIFVLFCNNLSSNYAQKQKLIHRIAGGSADVAHSFKYQVSIQLNKTEEFKHFCGGSIITDRFILTAAHCFVLETNEILNASKIKIVAGTSRLNSNSSVERLVEQIFIPKSFKRLDAKYYQDDIALIKLNKNLSVTKNDRLAIIKLPKTHLANRTYDGKVATASGFGAISSKIIRDNDGKLIGKPEFERANIRQFIQLKIEQCKKLHSGILCARYNGASNGRPHGTCAGDSGGPLVIQGGLIGIVSTGPTSCDMTEKQGRFTDVSHYLDFIKRAVNSSDNKSDMIILSSKSLNSLA